MALTHYKSIFREFLGKLNREVRISLTPIPNGKKWLFLVGCYNSGTTLLAELLGRHPDISALPTEGHFITDEFVKDYEIGLPRMWVDREDVFRLTEDSTGPDPHRLKKEWAMRMDLRKSVLLEKSPPNSARVRWLQKNFENSYFVAIVRNPYAVAEGISRKGDPQHKDNGWPIGKSARQWARSNEILREDAKYLERIKWISYEALADEPDVILNDITTFLSIKPFPDFDQGRSFKIHERDEAVRNMNKESIDRLTANQIREINLAAGPAIEAFGYDRIDS